jgi:HlyD family secretion protein
VKKILIIVLVVVVLGAVLFMNLRPRDKAEATVDVGTVKLRDLTSVVNCSGTIQPKRQVDVSANAMGTIVNLAVEEGQVVTKGDLLLEIDPTEYESMVSSLEASIKTSRADLQVAEVSLDKARQDHDRTQKLFSEGLATEEQLLAAETTLKLEQARLQRARHMIEQSQANLDKAMHDLEKVTITAPMTGVITRLNVEQGENAIMGTLNNPGTVLLVIADLGTMEAWVEVDETEVVNVELGQSALITIDAFPTGVRGPGDGDRQQPLAGGHRGHGRGGGFRGEDHPRGFGAQHPAGTVGQGRDHRGRPRAGSGRAPGRGDGA